MLHFRFERKLILIAAGVFSACAVATVALAPAAGEVRPFLQAFGIISCSSSTPCQEGKNGGTGAGLEGISALGKGVIGQTTFNSTSLSNGQAGLLGQDKSTSGTHDAGVDGTSTRGAGVSGTSSKGSGISGISTSGVGVKGTSSTSNGVFGMSSASGASGVFGSNSGGFGVAGTTTSGIGVRGDGGTNGIGVVALASNNDAVQGVISSGVASGFHHGVAGLDRSNSGNTNQGVFGDTTLGIGVEGVSYGSGTGVVGSSATGVGVNAVGGGVLLPALSVVSNGNDLIDGCKPGTANPCDANDAVFEVGGFGFLFAQNAILATGDISSNGNFNINGSGSYFKNGACVTGCTAATATSVGRAVTTYAPMVSQPTIEDFGEAQLVNGQADVRLSPDFANVVDRRASYLVFVTPEGDANLYVTQKTPIDFLVRETHGGHSTIAFSYRIVAKPIGSHEARLPMVELPKLHQHSRQHSRPAQVGR